MSRSNLFCILVAAMLVMVGAGCSLASEETRTVYITATPATNIVLSPVPDVQALAIPTGDPIRTVVLADRPTEHIVAAGDTLIAIATSYNLTLDAILGINNITDPNTLTIGQRLQLPSLPQEVTPDFKIIPDHRLVRAPGSESFDTATFILNLPGYIRSYSGEVTTRLDDGSEFVDVLTAAEIVDRVALEYSVDPRLLLALLEFRAMWLSKLDITDSGQTHPLSFPVDGGNPDRAGLYRQLTWAANQLNQAYYGWKTDGWLTLSLADGTERLLNGSLNAATVAVQYFFSQQFDSVSQWEIAVSSLGFYQTYHAYFGNPFDTGVSSHMPENLAQPNLVLPFAAGEVWFFTGGAHGGWGSGSAWAALDFAPPDDPPPNTACYVSDYWVRAVASGTIVRSENGAVVLDLDNDGSEATGWTILYLHLASNGRISAGSTVNPGDPIGRASCAGGFSTATHLHIARRYNGEWIAADCQQCSPHHQHPVFIMSEWEVISLADQEYQGFLVRDDIRRIAEQGRTTIENRIAR